jgi:hypothetical protein
VPHFSLQIDDRLGPVLTALLGVSQAKREALQTAGQAIPPIIPMRALVDTGASATCIEAGLLARLGLTPTGNILVHTPTTGQTAAPADQYDVSLLIPAVHGAPLFHRPAVAVTAHDFTAHGIHALIGRDILGDCLLVYNGTQKTFTIAY